MQLIDEREAAIESLVTITLIAPDFCETELLKEYITLIAPEWFYRLEAV